MNTTHTLATSNGKRSCMPTLTFTYISTAIQAADAQTILRCCLKDLDALFFVIDAYRSVRFSGDAMGNPRQSTTYTLTVP